MPQRFMARSVRHQTVRDGCPAPVGFATIAGHVLSARHRLIKAGPAWPLRGPHREAGVTAVELTVVLVIIGLVVISAYPHVLDTIQLMRAKGAAAEVENMIRLARQNAIATSATWAVNMTSTTIGIACSSDCPATLPPAEPTATILHGFTLVAGDATALTTAITFGRNGDATDAGEPRDIIVRDPDCGASPSTSTAVRDQHVTIAAAGRVLRFAPTGTCPPS